MRNLLTIRRFSFQFVLFLIFSGLIIVFALTAPKAFLGIDIYKAILLTVASTGLIALALTYLIIAGEIDLSIGSIWALSSLFFADVWVTTGNIFLAIFASLTVGFFAGLFNGLITVKLGVPSLIATLGTMIFWRGFISVWTGGYGISLLGIKDTFLYSLMASRVMGFSVSILWFVAFAVIFWIFLNRHKFGNHVYCTGDNLNSARAMGINTDRIKIKLFILVGLICSIGGMMTSVEISYFSCMQGELLLFDVIAAVAIGGTLITGGKGSIFGTTIGTLIICFLASGLIAMGFAGFYTKVAIGLVIIIAVVIQSRFKKRD